MARIGSAKVEVRKQDGTRTDEYLVQSILARADGERIFGSFDWQRYDEGVDAMTASGFWEVTNPDTTIIRIMSLEGYDQPDPGYGQVVTVTVTLYSDYGVPYPTSINRSIRYRQITDIDVRQYLLA